MSVYADTSFLVSLYVSDVHSTAASRIMRRALLPILITPLGELELFNALQLRLFREELTASEVKAAAALFRDDIAEGILSLKSLSVPIFERAKTISRNQTASLGTRTLDILHIASALVLHTDTFCTFDKSQRQLAKLEGLATPV